MGNRAKNHHYVPRSYLARFVDDKGFLHVYDRTARELRRQRPKEVMKINSYYRQEWAPEGIDPNVLETKLGEWLEAEAKNAIDKLHSMPEELDDQDIANLLTYFEVQRIRVPRQAEMGKALMRALILKLAPPDAVEAIASGKFKLEMKDAARFDFMRYSIGTLSPWFETMEWEVVTAGDGASFVTTDSPLSLYNPAAPPPAEAGIGLAGTKVFFPLSSSKALLMRHPEFINERRDPREVLPMPEHEDGHIEIISGEIWPSEVVDRFNWKLVQLSSNMVVANSPSVIQRCIDANTVQHVNRHGPTTAGGGFAASVGGPVIFTLASREHQMDFLNKLIGFRWSLYIVQNGNQLAYAMHEHSIMRMLGYVMGYFADGGRPVAPWSLQLNFNHKHQTIELKPEHFTADGENVTPALIQQIESMDPGWKVKGAEPVFEEAATKKRIKISENTPGHIDIQAMFDNIDKPRELTFYSVMDEVFGKR